MESYQGFMADCCCRMLRVLQQYTAAEACRICKLLRHSEQVHHSDKAASTSTRRKMKTSLAEHYQMLEERRDE